MITFEKVRKFCTRGRWFFGRIIIYCGLLNILSFKIGLILGTENCFYFGIGYVGIDFDLYRR